MFGGISTKETFQQEMLLFLFVSFAVAVVVVVLLFFSFAVGNSCLNFEVS